MAQQERTVEGTERYYQTRERAKARIEKHLGLGCEVKLTDTDLIDLLTGFALNERKREEHDKHPPDPVAQEFKAQETKPAGCYEKGRATGEPMFTLLARDVSAPWVVFEWVKRNWHHCRPEKLADALRIAQEMERWPDKKAAD